ncbi:hypothetical protein [Bradyrhizobium canariense]|uniref:hypothetical protein n=1 Tax=Bradyrhizobium canariense TaxID=255045 RepID=UPI000A19466D|nr:hypothetical protein [Bradyrhizobium canariense]OSI23737.1 hypothetical protein BST65_20745 [Bradyrhizobium canariense]OSI31006.1 hypothetical protein BST66_21100 [Bradyrhizobium canariense]OSI39911.1 hypothetical protein BSZ20_28650 [Bradyrhizobium canariense]OSI48201.1 hypothetical protein BST67_19130 [Bradyrhizobium canariense]OSI50086.1 hypothetical protein BSZ15_33985 [Bradyrhizobium canariense]
MKDVSRNCAFPAPDGDPEDGHCRADDRAGGGLAGLFATCAVELISEWTPLARRSLSFPTSLYRAETFNAAAAPTAIERIRK